MNEALTVSIIIPTYNCRPTLLRTLQSIEDMDFPVENYEVIVVDDGSSDGTGKYVKDLMSNTKIQVQYVYQENRGPAAARNRGIRMARGDYILFTDSDCLVDQDILKHYLRHFPADGLGGVGGNVVPDSKGIISQYLEHMGVWRPGRGESGIIYLVTANAFFLRDAVVKAGGFDEDFRRPGGEEPELCYRMLGKGFRFECDENAVVIHSHKLTLKSIMRMFFAYGRGRAIFVKKWPDVALWHLPTSFFSWGCTVLGVEAIRRFRFDFVRKFSLGRALVFLVLEYSRILARLYGYRSAMKERGRIHSSTQRGSSDLQSSDKDQRG